MSDGWPYEPSQMADGYDPPSASLNPPPSQPAPGPVLLTVRAYVAELGPLTGVRAPLAALAVWNAQALEDCRPDAPEAAKARLAQELRATLQALTTARTDDHDRLDQFMDEMGTPAGLPAPVGDTPDHEQADAGPEGRQDSEGAR